MQDTPGLVQLRSRDLKVKEEREKGKAVPVQTWKSPEGSRRIRLPDFKTVGT
jgi:hypothetical protein